MKTENVLLILFGFLVVILGGATVWLLSNSTEAPPAVPPAEADGPVEKIGAAVDTLLSGFESLSSSLSRRS